MAIALALLGLFADSITTVWRVVIVVIVVVFSVASEFARRRIGRAGAASDKEVQRLRDRLDALKGLGLGSPEAALRLLTAHLFKPGAMWRLTVYSLEPQEDSFVLSRKVRCASSEIYERSGRLTISIETSLLRGLRTYGLPFASESGEGPDRDQAPDDWDAWQLQVLKDTTAVSKLRMPTRKYAWCAVREPNGGRTIVLMGETVQPDLLNSSMFRSPLIEPLLALIVGQTEMPASVDSAVVDTVDVIQRLQR